MRRLGSVLMVICLCASASSARGQEFEEDAIETDRDAFTRSPRIVAPGRIVVEGSYLFLEQDADYDGHVYPDLLVRYGAFDWLELRLGWTYEVAKFHQLAHHEAEKVEEGLAIYGAKAFLTEASGWIPDSSLIVSGYTPTSGESNDTDLSFEYAFGWELCERWELEGGLRWFSLAEEEDHFSEWAPSVVLKAPLLTERFMAHVEYFALFSDGREEEYQQHYFGPGAHFLITPDIEIGARVFWGASEDSAEFICNAGMGVRF
jgi:hypothetical protein